jgi:conjugative relaxase-like TrwC/TraI family protein
MPMLSMKKVFNTSGGSGESGMPAYLKATEYFTDKHGAKQSASFWFGGGAAILGLKGPVLEKDMDMVANGFAPDGSKLRQTAGHKPEWKPVVDHEGKPRLDEKGRPVGAFVGDVIGTDMVFSANKSWDIVYAGAGPDLRDAMLEDHHESVKTALRAGALHAAETRRGKGSKDYINAPDLVFACCTHFAGREHDRAGDGASGVDPLIHTHAFWMNAAMGSDGKWGSVDAAEMFRWKKAIGAIYRADLAARTQKRGFNVEDDFRLDKNGEIKERFWKIAGVPDELCREMSGRRLQIENYLAQHPGSSPQEACLVTRASKDEPAYDELVNVIWKDRLDDWRARNPGTFPEDMRKLMNRSVSIEQEYTNKQEAKKSQKQKDQEILDAMHLTDSVWSRKDLVQHIGERSAGKRDAAGVIEETSAFLKRNDLEMINPEPVHSSDKGKKLARRHRVVRFADPKMVEMEKKMVRQAVERKDDPTMRLDATVVSDAIEKMEKDRGFTLSAEQRNAIEWVTLKTGQVAIVEGFAGSGKTTVSSAFVDAYKKSGYKVIGCATSWDAATKLSAESDGLIEGHSIASLTSKLAKGKITFDAKTVLVVDEAGMLGRSLTTLIDSASKAGSKIVLQGDRLQLQAVEAGSAMRLLCEQVGFVNLTDIRRQRNQADRDTANSFYAAGGDELRSRAQNQASGEKILARMEKRGQIQGFESQDEAMKYLVGDYFQSKQPDREKMIIAGTTREADELNHMVQKTHRDRGDLGPEYQVPLRHPRTEVKELIALSTGDRIRFGKKDADLDVVNGSRGTIIGLTKEADGRFNFKVKLESDIKLQNNRVITFTNNQYSALSLGYAGTVYRSQGQGREAIFHLGGSNVSRQLQLVAFTRQKSEYTLYGTAADLYDRSIEPGFASDKLQTNALTEGLYQGGKTTQQFIRERAAALDVAEKLPTAPSKAPPLPQPENKAPARDMGARTQPSATKPTTEKSAASQPFAQPTKKDQAPVTQRAVGAWHAVRERLQTMAREREREAARVKAKETKRVRQPGDRGLSQ